MRALLAIASLLLASCAHDINMVNARRYEQAAIEAQRNGDWNSAREYWWRAYVNAQSGRAPGKTLTVYLYEHGRSAGAVCRFEEAETSLKEAMKLDQEFGGPAYMDLVELARLNLDQRKYTVAAMYFAQSLPLLEQANAPTESPASYADVLEEYAAVLTETGERAKAKAFTARSQEMRAKNPLGRSITERTPYGMHCAKPKPSSP